MILLDTENYMIYTILMKKLNAAESGKPEVVDAQIADDDGIRYHIVSSQDSKTKISVNATIKFYSDLKPANVDAKLKSLYNNLYQSPSGCDVSLLLDITDPKNKEGLVKSISLFRKNLYESLLSYFVEIQSSGKSSSKLLLTIRPGELICFEAKPDRITVTYTISFSDEEDIIFGKVFLQEFKEGRKASQSAPQVLLAFKDPPQELSGVNVPTGPQTSYVTFVLTPAHVKEQNFQKTAIAIHNFFPYLKYHMKCSKAYLHSRMRAKTEDFVKIINRARPEVKSTEKKTFSGKTFVRS